jgi:hypothetical protein
VSDVPYQQAPQIEALKQERANAVAYGQTDRVAACDKQLASLGVKQDAAEKRSAAAEDDKTAKTAQAVPPKGRRGKESTQAQAESESSNEG